jgi:AraC-like DNA-binding protein
MIVFSHSGNFRVHSSAEIGLLDCTRVGFFNPLVPFQSAHPFGGSDSGSDLAIRPDVLVEIVARHDPGAADRPDRPFSFGSGPCDPQSFLMQRALIRRVKGGDPIDDLEIEELSLTLVDRLVGAAIGTAALAKSSRATARERDEAEALRGILSSVPGHRHVLDTLASRLQSSPFRLCRSFRAVTGSTIHRYLTHLRLQHAIGRLADGTPDLTNLAFDLGFSSHSHFTSVFRKWFGVTPEAVRRQARARDFTSLRRRFGPASAAGRR